MKGFGSESFGELYADQYDARLHPAMESETRDSVEVLADLADGGRVLELAIGTGRGTGKSAENRHPGKYNRDAVSDMDLEGNITEE